MTSPVLPASFFWLAEEECPRMRTLETKTLHKGVAGARHAFLPLPPNSNKLDVLVQVRQG